MYSSILDKEEVKGSAAEGVLKRGSTETFQDSKDAMTTSNNFNSGSNSSSDGKNA